MIKNSIQLKELIEKHHNPDLEKKEGHVTQIWQDGEITSQKSGRLMWQRNLHQINPPLFAPRPEFMPVQCKNGYAYATVPRKAANEILIAWAEWTMVMAKIGVVVFEGEEE